MAAAVRSVMLPFLLGKYKSRKITRGSTTPPTSQAKERLQQTYNTRVQRACSRTLDKAGDVSSYKTNSWEARETCPLCASCNTCQTETGCALVVAGYWTGDSNIWATDSLPFPPVLAPLPMPPSRHHDINCFQNSGALCLASGCWHTHKVPAPASLPSVNPRLNAAVPAPAGHCHLRSASPAPQAGTPHRWWNVAHTPNAVQGCYLLLLQYIGKLHSHCSARLGAQAAAAAAPVVRTS